MSDSNLESGDRVQDYEQFHKGLSDKLHELKESVPENYQMSVEYCPFGANSDILDQSDRVSVTIDSDEYVGNEGECGLDRFFCILRERGGIELLTKRQRFSDDNEYLEMYETKSHAWTVFVNSVSRAI